MNELERHRAGAALAALEAGDVDGATGILLALVEDEAPAEPSRLRCPRCELGFSWPGQLEDHRRIVHDDIDEAAA